jgi:hypothetical protein
MHPTNTAPLARSTTIRVSNPLKAWRETQRLRAFMAANQARIGTGAEAVAFAIDKVDDHFDRLQFLKDWQTGDLAEWPEYHPAALLPPQLTAWGLLLRCAAVVAGLLSGLLLLGNLLDYATRGPGDPLQVLITTTWGVAILVSTVGAWRGALRPAGGEG